MDSSLRAACLIDSGHVHVTSPYLDHFETSIPTSREHVQIPTYMIQAPMRASPASSSSNERRQPTSPLSHSDRGVACVYWYKYRCPPNFRVLFLFFSSPLQSTPVRHRTLLREECVPTTCIARRSLELTTSHAPSYHTSIADLVRDKSARTKPPAPDTPSQDVQTVLCCVQGPSEQGEEGVEAFVPR